MVVVCVILAIVIKLANLPVAQHKVVDGLHVWWVQRYGVGAGYCITRISTLTHVHIHDTKSYTETTIIG